MRNRLSYKEYLIEYYKYFNSFSEVVDKEDNTDEDVNKEDEDTLTADGKQQAERERECDKLECGDDEEDYNPCKFTQWMQISIAGEN